MFTQAERHYAGILAEITAAGLRKDERVIQSPQGAQIEVNGRRVLNFCANNYLGLANHPALVAAAREALADRGYGLSSVRFICGTQDLHKQLEAKLAAFLGTEDAILYSSCFDANGGLFETLLGAGDAIISDALNHASIIDGIRLCKARRLRYEHADMAQLESHLQQSQDCRVRMIATDGVFSMDGDIAPLPGICDLAEKYQAMVMVDDSHATGFVGKRGRGTIEHHNVAGRVDIITSTLGKALGGATGGFTAARTPIVDLLRNRSRPYLFSNSIPPAIAAAGIAAVDLLDASDSLRQSLRRNTAHFRQAMTAAGFSLKPGEHPICPIMLGDAKLAGEFARQLLDEGIYVIGFSYPVVPQGQARIRVQLSAAHTLEQIDQAIAAFTKVGKSIGVVAS
ncbi:MAG TPA: glycine C-acetyltransferase [Tepidisphaeraceae bacterium]|jgi:glycine C-acetyltransferase|nr:glycine C-acetyltransferase [Tepidisphaeraceae bacterium]